MLDLLERLRAALADRYAVESEIGRGGMAVVFKAEDLRHHRQVAIKVLHPELTATLGAERFLHEIEIVAGLQHPHILPLYESGESDGLLYYVMPFAEGESLRQRLDREKQLAVDESVRIAVEVADGLDYAHQKGVVHRDIKPGNILLSARHAVIADFGIARAIEAAQMERITSTGLGVGTPLYASPEQATAQETLDGRTDIYSLGCVLYEMLAGEPPLTGSTPKMIQARRLSETPTALHDLRETVPPALDQVIARALARVPADRFATASQFGEALQAAIFSSTPALQVDVTPRSAEGTPEAERSAGLRRLVVPAALVGVVGVVAVLLALANGWFESGPLQVTTSNITRVTTDPGWEFQPAISPDGKDVAYLSFRVEGSPLAVRSTIDLGGGGESVLSDSYGTLNWSPSWTADGASVRFIACPPEAEGCEYLLVGSRGGSPVALGNLPGSNPAWSADGDRAAFFRGDSIFAFQVRGAEPQLLGVHPVSPSDLHSLAWSPDGRWIAYVDGNGPWRFSASVAKSSIWILDARGGRPIQVTDEHHLNQSPQWLPDGRHVLFVSDQDGARGVFVVPVGSDGPRSPPRRVPGLASPHTISVSTDGQRLAYSRFEPVLRIRSVPLPESSSISITEGVPITPAEQVIQEHSVSPAGDWIAFDSDIGGEFAIYKQRLDGGTPQVLARLPGGARSPDWSPDGFDIAFSSASREASGNIYTIPAIGGTPEQIANPPGRNDHPDWSPDGLAIAFVSLPPGERRNVWIVSRGARDDEWGEPAQLTDFGCSYPHWAPDGSGLACSFGSKITFVSPEGDVLWRYDSSIDGLGALRFPIFARDGSRIYFWAGQSSTHSWDVWWIPPGGGSATMAVEFDAPSSIGYGLSVGPDELYLTFAEFKGDIYVADLNW